MLKYIKLLIIKYRLNDLFFYFFSKNKFKYHFLKSDMVIDDYDLQDIFKKYSNIINDRSSHSKIWKDILDFYYKDLSRAFLENDFHLFKSILNKFLKDNVIRGAEDGSLHKYFIFRISHKVALIKAIHLLSNYLKITNYQNPYQPEIKKEKKINTLYSSIEKLIPISSLPNVGSPYGYKWKDSVINYRFLESIYWNENIKNFLKIKSDITNLNILEIGAGSGLNPIVFYYYFSDKVKKIYLIDIPQILLFQEFFIKSSLSKDVVSNKFEFIENLKINTIEKTKFDIFINKDSFPEINDYEANKYLNLISKNHGSILFSINHESKISNQRSLSERIKNYENIELISRDQFNIRKGYVKEIYYIK